MIKVVLLRHGESTWNVENRFTGWTDVDLSATGVTEARHAGRLLRDSGYTFDHAYCSVLKRAIRTLWMVMEEMDAHWLPVQKDWRLNERHYGALQGLNKVEIAEHYGAEQVHLWRRGFAVRPPAMGFTDPRLPRNDARYAHIASHYLPNTESLEDTMKRSIDCWQENILPRVQAQKRVLIVAHHNTLRALMKHLEGISDADIMELNIPTGKPLVYEFDNAMNVQSRYYLEDDQSSTRAA